MSIKPLDLQTLFLKMANVGKEQASIQKSVENQQAREANQLVKKENDRDHSVNKAEEDKDSEKIKDKESNQPKKQRNSSENKKDEKSEDSEKVNYFTDPERGHKIDISG